MSCSVNGFLRRVRIHDEEGDAIARALHHKARINSLLAVRKNVLRMTFERKSMKRKTIFKRISLAVVAALGFGLLSTGPTQAVPFSATLTIDAATDAVKTNETATAVLTNAFSATAVGDSVTIRYTCATAATNTCPVPMFYQSRGTKTDGVPAPDTANVMPREASETVNVSYSSGEWTDSIVATTAAARSVVHVKATSFTKAGTYTYNFYSTRNTNTTGAEILVSPFTWTVTVTSPYTAAGTGSIYIAEDALTVSYAKASWGTTPADSAIIADRGTLGSVAVVGYALVSPKGAAGETAITYNGVAHGQDIRDSVTVEISGPGYVSSNAAPTTAGNYSKSAVLNSTNTGSASSTETLVILSDGTVGTATLTFKGLTGAVIGTKTVKFTGPIASISSAFFANRETTVTRTATFSDTVTVSAYAKDSAGELVTNTGRGRTLFLYSSDTTIIGDINGTSLAANRAGGACTVATTGLWTCVADIKESGTATLTLRDSSTVTASTISFDLGVVTVVGANVGSLTATLNKATYAPGERAVLTLSAKDTQARTMSGRGNDSSTTNRTYSSAFTEINTSSISWTASNAYPYCGSVGGSPTGGTCTSVTTSTYSPFGETGSETRVITMPTTAGTISYEYRKADGTVLATVSAQVVDPNATAIAAAQAAAVAAADAATDAALEAIDAANAATDAANLAAEAADAATVAAEEARDAADAATAAVEALATEVATLMAALKAQITTLARTVAKIAKKVNA
jgi:hypothetical protein